MAGEGHRKDTAGGRGSNMLQGIRLDKLLARSGVASRRSSADIISDGRVSVDGQTVKSPGCRVDASSCIRVDGQPIATRHRSVYIKVHKPPGYITTTDDPRGRDTVMQLVTDIPQRIYPVGRLDRESSGLLLMTNDGSWAQRITHPRYEVPKVYLVGVSGRPDEEVLEDLLSGIPLADGQAGFDQVDIVQENGNRTGLRVVLREGRYREIRRLLATVGHPVLQLRRVQIGTVELGKLAPGEWVHLDDEDVEEFCERRCEGNEQSV